MPLSVKVGTLMESVEPSSSYVEDWLKSRVRQHFASQASRAGLPEGGRELIQRRMFQAVAVLTLIAYVGTGTGIYFFALFFWAGWGGLIQMASDWQRELLRQPVDGDANARARAGEPSEKELAMAAALGEIAFASVDSFNEAAREELGW